MIELFLLVALTTPEDLILERTRQRARCYIAVAHIEDKKLRRKLQDRCEQLYGRKQT